METGNLKISSQAFEEGWSIPPKYTCDGENMAPPLNITGTPKNAKSLVIIMEDPDAVMGNFFHWIKWNVPPDLTEIKEGTEPPGIAGRGSAGRLTYVGPCPPDREHRYLFKVYALDTELNLKEGAKIWELTAAMKDHIIAFGQLMGRYNKPI